MNKGKILNEIDECIKNTDLAGINENIGLLLKDISDEDASMKLAQLLGDNYTQFKSDYLAKVLEIIIKKRLNLAFLNHPYNFLFQAVISAGSFEMYECYVEEAVMPFLANVIEDEHEMHYMELLNTAQELTEKLFKENKKCIKGRHYNGAISRKEQNENIVLLGEQDYIIMEDVVERYNSIVGRALIIEDLNKRSGLEF